MGYPSLRPRDSTLSYPALRAKGHRRHQVGAVGANPRRPDADSDGFVEQHVVDAHPHCDDEKAERS